MVQCITARFVLGDYRTTSRVTEMLNQLQWPTLQERRAQAIVTMMYHIVYELVEIPVTLLVPTMSLRGHDQKFLVPYDRTMV